MVEPGVSRQSLVTPIDWKPVKAVIIKGHDAKRRQSLVTPIDWKLEKANPIEAARPAKVANLW